MKLLHITANVSNYPQSAKGMPPFDLALLQRHQPDEHWVILDDRDQAAARCSLWWRSAPKLPNHKVGIIGHYTANGNTPARSLLDHA